MNLRFCLLEQGYNPSKNPQGHPQNVMEGFGIKYKYAIPQSAGGQWWFIGCENTPKNLPPCISEMKIGNYHDLIGYGLSKEIADDLTRSNIVKDSI